MNRFFLFLHVTILLLYIDRTDLVSEYIKKGVEIKQDINQKKIIVGTVRNNVNRTEDV